MCIQTKGTDIESGPLAIYGLDGDDSHLPVLVGICRDKEGEGCLHTVKPYLDSREKAGLTVHARRWTKRCDAKGKVDDVLREVREPPKARRASRDLQLYGG